MNTTKKMLKATSALLAILMVLIPSFSQSASAAMIGTEAVLQSHRSEKTREYLHDLLSREKIKKALVVWGVSPPEAQARIDCLSDAEIEQISELIADLPAAGNAAGFVVIVGAVILILVIIVEYFSSVKMFPELQSNN